MSAYWENKRRELIAKLPTIFDVLNMLSYADEKWALEKTDFRLLYPSYIHEGKFDVVKFPDGKERLIPMGISFNVYYRGESSNHCPCLPSLYRRDKNGHYMEDSKIFLERLKTCELELLIEDYPITHIFRSGITRVFSDGTTVVLNLSVDAEALAQHYGIKTNLMDLTIDKFVAAFFATTKYEKGRYAPITPEDSAYGVFYRYIDTSAIDDIFSKRLHVVGLQPFSRPGEQAGFVLELKKGEDFRKFCSSKIKFRQDEAMSKLIFNYMNHAQKLFPCNILEGKAKAICMGKKYSKQALALCQQKYFTGEDASVIQSYVKKEGLFIVDGSPYAFSQKEKQQVLKEWEEKGFEQFQSKIVLREFIPSET